MGESNQITNCIMKHENAFITLAFGSGRQAKNRNCWAFILDANESTNGYKI